MLHAIGTRLSTVALGMMAVGALLAPGEARAQSYDCYGYVHLTDSSGNYLYDEFSDPIYGYQASYSECGEVAPATSALGGLLSGVGDSVINQQLNFGGMAGFAAPTGRLRHSSHDGLEVKRTGGTRTSEFDTDEGSVFANGTYDLPGTYFGGRVRVSALAGYDRLSQDAADHSFKSEIDAFIYGGSYLWSKGNFYSMSLIIGLSGEADGSNAGGNYNYDISGYFTNSLYGYTFDMAGGWRFDTRVNIGHYDVSTDRFEVAGGGLVLKGVSEAWSAGITGTLFTLLESPAGGTMRPYILVAYKNVFDEEIEVKGDRTAKFDQANDYGKVEVGFDYVEGVLTYGVAGYTEFSEDESTVGARLGVSVKLQ